jgi:hypothetical protein
LTTLEEQIRERVQSQTHVAIHDGIAPWHPINPIKY